MESALSLYDEVVLSTWEEQNTEFLSALQPKIRIIKSKDPGTLIPNYRKQIKDKPFVNEINTLRQFTSTLNGLLSLNEEDISYAVKIRTDQLLDLKLLKEALFKLVESNRTYLTPYFSKTTPFAIPDFFLAGKLSELISLCRLMQSRSLIFHENVHRDLALKSLVLHSDILSSVRLEEFFYMDDRPSPLLWTYLELLPSIWATGSQKLFESIYWRGKRFKQLPLNAHFEIAPGDFKIQSPQKLKPKIDYDRFVSTSTGHKNFLVLPLKQIATRVSKSIKTLRRFVSYVRHRRSML
jgi:hypothetical protein